MKGKPRRTNRVPSNDRLESLSVAARIRPKCDIVDTFEAIAIEPWIQEPERCSTCRKAVVVEQRDYACHGL